MNKNILNKIDKLMQYFKDGTIPTIENHEVNPGLEIGSRLNYLYFTLPVSINFQRSSPNMWKAALKTFEDKETNYLFYPEKLVNIDIEKVREDLRKHGLSLQPNKHTHIWYTISKSLADEFDADPRKLIRGNNYDVQKMISFLRQNNKRFPYLNGPKLSNYWLFILSKFTNIRFVNKDKISIIPDTHIKQATLKLGVSSSLDTKIVEKAWFELLRNSKYAPVDLHSMLWHWSRNKFKPVV